MSTDSHEYADQIRQMEIEGRLPWDVPGSTPGEAQVTAPDPHDGCNETIKARERSITDLLYRVRELESQIHGLEVTRQGDMQDYSELATERDEWKAKAEQMEKAEDRYHDYIRELEKQVEDYARQLRADSHYCCYHIRWETREGAGV